jgi:hypothetical protein
LYSLALWCLAAETATLLAASDPNRVLILRFNRLVAGDPSELEAATQAFGATPHSLHAALPARPDFTRLTDGRFVVPDGTTKSLLTASETALIESVAGPWMLRLGLVQGAFAVTERTSGVRAMRALVASLTSLGRAAPAAAKSLADFIFYPGRTVRRGARRAEAKLRRVFGRGRTAPTSGCADL